MESTSTKKNPFYVLFMGNNPMDLSKISEDIKNSKGSEMITEAVYNVTDLFKKIKDLAPTWIIIDENIGRSKLKMVTNRLNRETRSSDIPVSILKNSNYQESGVLHAEDFILKEEITAEHLYPALVNMLKFRRTHVLFKAIYRKRKRQFKNLLSAS